MALTVIEHKSGRVAFLIDSLLFALLAAWVIWESTIAFSSGVHTLPVFEWRIRGGIASGLEVLFGCAGLSIGLMAILTVLVNRLVRNLSFSG